MNSSKAVSQVVSPVEGRSATSSVANIESVDKCMIHPGTAYTQICLSTTCQYGRKMCAQCTHPNCDQTKFKSMREFLLMVKANLAKEDAKKYVYYESGQFLSEFKESFLAVVERERKKVIEQFDMITKLITNIQQTASQGQQDVQILKLCETYETWSDFIILENFDTCLKIAADRSFGKNLLLGKQKQADARNTTMSQYDSDIKLLQNKWGDDFIKLKDKYFTQLNNKQDVQVESRQLVLALGENLSWITDLLNQQTNDSHNQRMESWNVDWQIFQRIDIDDVSVHDQLHAIKKDNGMSKRLVLVTNSGPVFMQMMNKLVVDKGDADDSKKGKNKFQLLGIIIDITKDKFSLQIDILKKFSSQAVPQIYIGLNGIEANDKSMQFVAQHIQGMKKIPKVRLELQSSQLNDKTVVPLANSIRELKQLSQLELNLGKNKLGTKGAQFMAQGLRSLKGLTLLNLDLQETDLGEEGPHILASFLSELISIQTLSLNLWGNNLNENGAKLLSYSLREASKQIISLTLILCYNNIGEKGAQLISQAIPQFKVILTLNINLWNNNVGSKGVTHLANAFAQMGSLRNLDCCLWFNQVNESGVNVLSKSFTHLGALTNLKLNLRSNPIFDSEVIKMLESLKTVTTLKNVVIDLKQTKITTIPAMNQKFELLIIK